MRIKIRRRRPFAIWADVFTITRGFGAPAGLILCWLIGVRSLTVLLGFLLVGWMTDMADGYLARKANQPSWVGEKEVFFDLLMLMGCAFYLVISFRLPFLLSLIIWVWLALAALSIYGAPRHDAKSYIFAIESRVTVIFTAGVAVYILFWERSTASMVLILAFVVIGLINIRGGLAARKRVKEGLASFREDIRKPFKAFRR